MCCRGFRCISLLAVVVGVAGVLVLVLVLLLFGSILLVAVAIVVSSKCCVCCHWLPRLLLRYYTAFLCGMQLSIVACSDFSSVIEIPSYPSCYLKSKQVEQQLENEGSGSSCVSG